ncbi:hypothetical protein PR048_030420 [Dryococelus australis]|uniref:Mid1-interacting protein n=1 Tax=Dryococelus australis TaxID=614101 RepID=A0ABQ9G8X6_9NEOP|nr:hypothetical protein PR048_030420 [Dryococelus australis]
MHIMNSQLDVLQSDKTEFSRHSLLHAVLKFVKAVNDMNNTILVPSRLIDLPYGDREVLPDVRNSTNTFKQFDGKFMCKHVGDVNLYALYTMINCMKNELMWGHTPLVEEQPASICSSSSSFSSSSSHGKGHTRTPSSVSVASNNSVPSISDGDMSETGTDSDPREELAPDYSRLVTEDFTQHLHGLNHSLEKMTDLAMYLTTRYQDHVTSVES